MTKKERLIKQKINLEKLTSGQICFGLFCIFSLLLILRNADVAITYISRGLSLCAKTVIPSLFPFMVISELIVSSGLGGKLLKVISRPLQRLFRLSSDGCCAVLLGMLCGFPVGARCAVLSYDQGKLSQAEAERILCFSNNPSSAFVITAVGSSLWGNRKFGVALYVAVLTASILTGVFIAHFPQKANARKEEAPIEPITAPTPSLAKLFCQAIRSATASILLVCAYVLFFSALVGTFHYMPGMQRLPAAAKAFLFCLFELSSGVSQATTLAIPMQAALLCAFACGWSGISVHCQILSVCDTKRLSLRPYVLSKLLQACITPLLLAAILALFPTLLIPGLNV